MITVTLATAASEGNPLATPPTPVGMAVKRGSHPPEYFTGEKMASVARQIADRKVPVVFDDGQAGSAVFSQFGCVIDDAHDLRLLRFSNNPYDRGALPVYPDKALTSWVKEHTEFKDWRDCAMFVPPDLLAASMKGYVDDVYEAFMKLDRGKAYELERQASPTVLRMNRAGLRVDVEGLVAASQELAHSRALAHSYLRLKLGDADFSNHSALMGALDKARKLDAGTMFSSRTDELLSSLPDRELASYIAYWRASGAALDTLNRIKVAPRVYPYWDQIGTVTGRITCPLQSIGTGAKMGLAKKMAPIPNMRRFILPEEGEVVFSRDWASQDFRMAAHFERGPLLEAFKENSQLDPHSMVRDAVRRRSGKQFSRDAMKKVGFGILYGMGAPGLSRSLGVSKDAAREIRDWYAECMPHLIRLFEQCKRTGREGGFVTTLGGRRYVSPPVTFNEETRECRSYEYRLMSHLIQGSSADQMKMALAKPGMPDPMFLLYDQAYCSASPGSHAMEDMRAAMSERVIDCPVVSVGYKGENMGEINREN